MQSLLDAAAAAQREGNSRELARIASEIIAQSEAAGDAQGLAQGHYYAGLAHFLQSSGGKAHAAYERALDIATKARDKRGILQAKIGLAAIAGEFDLDVEALHRLSEEALVMARELRDEKAEAVLLGSLAEACHLQGDYARSIRYAKQSAAMFERLERWSSAGAQYATIAHVQALRRDYAQALESMRAAWSYLQREDVAFHRAWYFQVWFLIAAGMQRWEVAATLYGFLGHYRDVNEAPRLHGMLPTLSGPIERQYRELGHDRAIALAAQGETYTVEQAQALAETLAS